MGQDGTITERLMDRQLYDRSRSVQTLEYIIFVLLGIAIPLLLKQPQLLVGSTVNFVLIMTAMHLLCFFISTCMFINECIFCSLCLSLRLLNQRLFSVLRCYGSSCPSYPRLRCPFTKSRWDLFS